MRQSDGEWERRERLRLQQADIITARVHTETHSTLILSVVSVIDSVWSGAGHWRNVIK